MPQLGAGRNCSFRVGQSAESGPSSWFKLATTCNSVMRLAHVCPAWWCSHFGAVFLWITILICGCRDVLPYVPLAMTDSVSSTWHYRMNRCFAHREVFNAAHRLFNNDWFGGFSAAAPNDASTYSTKCSTSLPTYSVAFMHCIDELVRSVDASDFVVSLWVLYLNLFAIIWMP